MNSIRKDWDTYFMDIAFMASTRSRCGRRKVGAVLVQGKKLLGTAYNGAPMGCRTARKRDVCLSKSMRRKFRRMAKKQ